MHLVETNQLTAGSVHTTLRQHSCTSFRDKLYNFSSHTHTHTHQKLQFLCLQCLQHYISCLQYIYITFTNETGRRKQMLPYWRVYVNRTNAITISTGLTSSSSCASCVYRCNFCYHKLNQQLDFNVTPSSSISIFVA